MVAGLHGPDFVAPGGEGLLRIGFHTDIYEDRVPILYNVTLPVSL